MIKSMTGYGKAQLNRDGKCIEVEIKSLNSKSLDINTKIPANFKDKDIELRGLIGEVLERGKIDFTLNYNVESGSAAVRINESLLNAYFEKLNSICKSLNIKPEETTLLATLLRFPDIQKTEPDPVSEDEWQDIFALVKEALCQLDKFRIQEGQNLRIDFVKRIELILSYVDKVEPLEANRVPVIKERLLARFEELKTSVEVDPNRLEQELIYYLEKLDITEEKVRLRNHCKYFLETLDIASAGKKLGFIAQEMGREINTLGSKANDSEIQKIVVMMKDELEKIKEQVLNIL